jgi:hypothetical protein
MRRDLIQLLKLIISAAVLAICLLMSTSKPLPGHAQATTAGGNSIFLPLVSDERGFADSFATGKPRTINEGKFSEIYDPNWWLNSGAYFTYNGNNAMTVQGELNTNDPRRIYYSSSNPAETDNGYHPQNIFRLITRTQWKTYTQEVYFKINRYILSSDPHRQPSNGLLLFNHYQDGDNLYYCGLRVDGKATIKKKINATYYILSDLPVLPGVYNRDTAPNLIPTGVWIGIRSVVTTKPDHSVSIDVYSDIGRTGKWTLIASAVDNSSAYGGPPIDQAGYAGIRTDFMDVEFSGYWIKEK